MVLPTLSTPAEATSPVPTYGRCRTNDDCKSGSDHCLRPGETDACPIPPYMVPCPAPACTSNKDCTTGPGGTCVSYVIDYCPRCDGWQCQYPPPPPPPCTKSPDSCSAGMRCRSDGACEPVPCGEGYACASDSRCSVGSSRADGHGCELIPCGQGFACEENTRCTAPTDPSSHGCTTLPCKADGDCDCGFCVWARARPRSAPAQMRRNAHAGGRLVSCSTSLGTCSSPLRSSSLGWMPDGHRGDPVQVIRCQPFSGSHPLFPRVKKFGASV